MRKLSREYGWTVVGVYGLLSVLDFPLCYLAVKLLGTDRIGRYEHAVIQAFWGLVHIPFPDFHKQPADEVNISEEGAVEATVREGGEVGRAVVSKTEASMQPPSAPNTRVAAANVLLSHLDYIGTRIRRPQVANLHSSSAYRRSNAQSCQNTQGLGMGHWEAETETLNGHLNTIT